MVAQLGRRPPEVNTCPRTDTPHVITIPVSLRTRAAPVCVAPDAVGAAGPLEGGPSVQDGNDHAPYIITAVNSHAARGQCAWPYLRALPHNVVRATRKVITRRRAKPALRVPSRGPCDATSPRLLVAPSTHRCHPHRLTDINLSDAAGARSVAIARPDAQNIANDGGIVGTLRRTRHAQRIQYNVPRAQSQLTSSVGAKATSNDVSVARATAGASGGTLGGPCNTHVSKSAAGTVTSRTCVHAGGSQTAPAGPRPSAL